MLAAILATACGGDDGTGPKVAVPASLVATAGDGQTGTVAAAVPIAPTIRVTDAKAQPIAGQVVTFSVVAGGGSVATTSATTSADGTASAGSWTLGTTAGENRVTATVGTLAPVTFTATGRAGAAAVLTKQAGDTQTGTVGQALSVAPGVLVRDAHGNVVAGQAVSFAVSAGGGSVSGGSATTNASGVATAGGWTLGPVAGANGLTVTAGGAPSVTFTATGNVGAAAQIGKQAGDTQSALAGQAVAVAPSVIVRDALNNVIANQAVLFTVSGGGGSVTGGSTVTNASGVATLGGWTLGTTAGPNTLTVTAGAAPAVTFTATGTVGPPATITKLAGDNQTGQAGQALPTSPSVVVRDAANNAVPNQTVVFAVTAGGGSVGGGGIATTNASGVATAGTWTLGPAPGNHTLVVTAGNAPAVSFTATATAGTPTQLNIQLGDNQTATAGTNVATAPAVILRDAQNNPVPGIVVTFSVASGNGAITAGSATTGANGVATVGSWRLGNLAGINTLNATAPNLGPVTFTATGTAGPASLMEAVSPTTQSGTAGAAVASPPSVKVTDQFGNPIAARTVTFAVASGGGSIVGGTVATNLQGIATAGQWTLGATPGTNTATATTTGVTPVTFSATAAAATATQIAKQAGDNQTAFAGTTVAIAPAVIARDAQNNPVSGVVVTFTVASGGGAITGGTVTTGADGTATVGSWRLGNPVGTNTLQAAAVGLPTATFTATGTVGPATIMAAVSPTTQNGTAGAPVASPPSVRVTDQFGNPVAARAVTFAVVSGGGSIVGGSAVTNAQGIATVGQWTLGATPGTNTAAAASTGLTTLTFTANAASQCAATIPYTIGSSVTRTLTSNSCLQGPYFTDIYSFTLAGATAIQFNETSAQFDTWLDLAFDNAGIFASNDNSTGATTNSRITVMLPAGTYRILASTAPPNVVGTYTLSSTQVPFSTQECEVPGLGNDVHVLAPMTLGAQVMGAGDCFESGKFIDRFSVWMDAGVTYTITMTSSAFDTFLNLRDRQTDALLSSNDDFGGTTNSRVIFVPQQSGLYNLQATTFSNGAGGSYSLTIAR